MKQISKALEIMMTAVFEDGAPAARADLDFDGELEGWTLRMILMPTEDDEVKQPTRDGSGESG